MNGTIQERFWSKVDKQQDGCWLWTGEKSVKGYGRFEFWIAPKKYRKVYSHRFAWEQSHGPVPAGLQLDHLCRVRNCVNPDHLEIVTSRENTLRGMSSSAVTYRTGICKRGHALTDDNIYICSNGYRTCLSCLRFHEELRRGKRNEYFRQRDAKRALKRKMEKSIT